MIGDLLSNIAHAQKLSIEQIQKAIQDGTLPSYVGMPLLQEKVQQRDEAAQLLSGQKDQNQPSIGQQIMQKADQAVRPQMPQMQPQVAQQGIAAAPSNLPQQMAGGGIVAFASGDIINEDEYMSPDDREDAELAQLYGTGTDNDLIQAIAARGRRSDIHPSAGIQVQSRSYGMDPSMASHKYAGMGLKFAQDLGVSPKLAMHVMHKETGNLDNPETAKSKAGAMGVMQLMPRTAKELGVTNPMDPIQNIHAGVRYLSQLSNKYHGDDRLAAMAYNWGPGNVDKWLKSGGDMAKVPKETRNYVANYAEGGDVKGYSGKDGDSEVTDNEYLNRSRGIVQGVNDLAASFTDPRNYDLYSMYQRHIGQPFAKAAHNFINQSPESQAADFNAAKMQNLNIPFVGSAQAAPAPTNAPAAVNTTATTLKPDALGRYVANPQGSQAQTEASPSAGIAGANVTPNAGITQLSPSDQYQQAILQDIQDRTEQAKKDKESNKYMALLSAGLGMLGSRSPYALTGIGEGAQQGVAAYAALQKQQADEAKDIAAERLGLYKYQSAAEQAKRHYDILEQAQGEKPTLEDKNKAKFDLAWKSNPQIAELDRQMNLEDKNGTLTPSKQKYYQDSKNKILSSLAKRYGVSEDAVVNLEPYVEPAKVEKPSLFSRIFGSSSSAKPTSGAVDVNNPLLAK